MWERGNLLLGSFLVAGPYRSDSFQQSIRSGTQFYPTYQVEKEETLFLLVSPQTLVPGGGGDNMWPLFAGPLMFQCCLFPHAAVLDPSVMPKCTVRAIGRGIFVSLFVLRLTSVLRSLLLMPHFSLIKPGARTRHLNTGVVLPRMFWVYKCLSYPGLWADGVDLQYQQNLPFPSAGRGDYIQFTSEWKAKYYHLDFLVSGCYFCDAHLLLMREQAPEKWPQGFLAWQSWIDTRDVF